MEQKYLTIPITSIQETREINHFNDRPEDDDSDDDTLSLCDLPLHHENDVVIDDDHVPALQLSSSPTNPDANFEFSTAKNLHINSDTDILLFGKSMFSNKNPKTTSSFRYNKLHQETASDLHVSTLATTTPPPTPTPRRSRSVRLPETGKWPYKSSGTVSSSNWKAQYNVLIGLAARCDPPRMELSEMRKRQSRRAPPLMFAGFSGEQPVVASGKRGRKGPWSLLRPCRSNLVIT